MDLQPPSAAKNVEQPDEKAGAMDLQPPSAAKNGRLRGLKAGAMDRLKPGTMDPRYSAIIGRSGKTSRGNAPGRCKRPKIRSTRLQPGEWRRESDRARVAGDRDRRCDERMGIETPGRVRHSRGRRCVTPSHPRGCRTRSARPYALVYSKVQVMPALAKTPGQCSRRATSSPVSSSIPRSRPEMFSSL